MRLIKKIAEVYREDGLWRLLATSIRFLYGNLRIAYLRSIRKKPRALTRVQGNKMLTNVYDPGIGSELIVRGMHEKLSTREIQRFVRPGMRVVDLGANIGYYAIMEGGLVGVTGKVYAIEPVPDNYELLAQNIKLNRYDDIVKPYQLAIGDKSGKASIHISTVSNRHSFVMPRSEEFVGMMDVPMLTFDDFVRQERIDVGKLGLVRMDVEGYEAKIIPGMTEALKGCRHLRLFIEFHQRKINKIPGCSFHDCLLRLKSLGARFDMMLLTNSRGKVVVRDMTIDDVLASDRIMSVSGMESWLTIDGS